MKDHELLALKDNFNHTPRERLSPLVKNILDNGANLIDVHCHIFDNDSTPLGDYVNTRIDSIPLLLLKLFKKNIDDFYDILFMTTSAEILEHYFSNYYNRDRDILVPLMMDLDIGWKKKSVKTVSEQIDEIKDLMNIYPIIPFFAIDPRRTKVSNPANDLYSNFHKAFTGDNKFSGIKVYPSLGYSPSDFRLDPIYKICDEYQIPVTTHCGSSIIHTRVRVETVPRKIFYRGRIVSKPYKYYKLKANGNRKQKPFKIIANELNHANKWEPVLEQYQNLKINFGHFGGVDAWEAFANYPNSKSNRVAVINAFAQKYPNRVFADVSSTFTKGQTYQRICNQFNREPIIEDILMYGSDIHVTLPFTDFDQELTHFKNLSGSNFEKFTNLTPRRFLGI